MTVSLPSALAAATRASMPPPPEADVCFDQSVAPAVDVEPQAATMSTAATAIPKRWNRCQFIPSTLPSDEWLQEGRPAGQRYIAPAPAVVQESMGSPGERSVKSWERPGPRPGAGSRAAARGRPRPLACACPSLEVSRPRSGGPDR